MSATDTSISFIDANTMKTVVVVSSLSLTNANKGTVNGIKCTGDTVRVCPFEHHQDRRVLSGLTAGAPLR